MSATVSIPMQRRTTVSAAPVRRRPLLGGHLYMQALWSADYRCECSAWCGRTHGTQGGRCAAVYDVERPLHVIPGDPSADPRRVVDVDQVLVVCAGCHDRRVDTERVGLFERGLREDG